MFKAKIYEGIGDIFYQRPFVKELVKQHGEVAITTAWPDLFYDIPVKYWFTNDLLRIQLAEKEKLPGTLWEKIHKRAPPDVWLGYGVRDLTENKTIVQGLERTIPLTDPYDMTFVPKPEWLEIAKQLLKPRTVLVRRPSVRREYNNPSRNPDPEAFRHALSEIKARGYTTISIGWLDTEHEWLTDKRDDFIDFKYENGEIPIPIVTALMTLADFTLTGVGYATPMACAVNAKCLTIFGGEVPFWQIFDPRMPLDNAFYVAPENPCACYKNSHDCNKFIEPTRISEAIIEMERGGGSGIFGCRQIFSRERSVQPV